MSRRRTATNDEKRASRAAGNNILPNPPAISQRHRQENCETQKKNATARLHRLIERRCRINQHRTNDGRSYEREDVFGRITEGELLDSAIVATNKIRRDTSNPRLIRSKIEELNR